MQSTTSANLQENPNLNPNLASLTSAQREAVLHVEGPLLILAGPGSGKTRVVTQRIAHLLQQGVPASQILALTFTNKAADEMRSRIEALAPGQSVWTSTFHRFCARLLRDYGTMVGIAENFTIYDTGDSLKVVKRTIEELNLSLLHVRPERIARAISWAKNQLVDADAYVPRTGHPIDPIVAQIYPLYQARLQASAAVDFDDLLLYVVRLLRENPEIRSRLDDRYRYILVDEYQDTNLAQYGIVRALSIDHSNLAVTGDPDQSIYAWRGANLNNILDFEHDYPEVRVVRLEQNYRSTQSILRVAQRLIQQNVRRKEKDLFTENAEGMPVRLVEYPTHIGEAEGIAAQIADEIQQGRSPRDFSIFYRMNALSRSFEFALRDRGIPFQLINGLEFYQRKEIKDAVAYLSLINNPRDDVALLRVINTPPRGIGKRTIDRLQEHAVRRGLTLLEAAREAGLIDSLAKRAATLVARFVAMSDRLREHAQAPVEEILGHVLHESGYEEYLQDSDLEEDHDRLSNLRELLTDARQFDEANASDCPLEAFLERTSLVNDIDQWEDTTDCVTLMTLHAAKGLEFPVVYIVATEQGLIPHERSIEDPFALEEERRLLFVGITRAKEQLQLSRAKYRDFRGRSGNTVPSPFLMELPRDEMEQIDVAPVRGQESNDEAARASRRKRFAAAAAGVTTAAKLLDEETAAASPSAADEFFQGMVVMHPEYGVGKIIALGGGRANRKATVAFPTAGEKTFVVEKSPLRPAKRPE